MLRYLQGWVLIASSCFAYQTTEAWKSKRVADWTDAETKEVLTASPWGVMVTPTVKKVAQQPQGNRGGGIVGIPGVGRRRAGGQSQDSNENKTPVVDSVMPLNVRWESALPIREAELKARETNAPAVDEDHYAIAVYGIPNRFAKDADSMGEHLKGQASLKREGQKDLKPTHVDVIQREDGLVVVFLFPKTKELTAQDSRAEFEALIGPFQVNQSFHLDEMTYQGKIEL
jgi:hypothetical protein